MVNVMPYCSKCGAEVKEENQFCPKCGASLKIVESRSDISTERYRREKAEKQEKNEKQEKEEKMEKEEQQEKYEKQEFGILGPVIGGIILIILGFILYLSVSGILEMRSLFPFFLVIVGIIVIVGVAIGAVIARKRNPIP